MKNSIYWVLNLVINGIPSIQKNYNLFYFYNYVLNLVINGIPSIPYEGEYFDIDFLEF